VKEMKICRYNDDRLGIVDGDEVVDVTAALDVIPAYRWPVPEGDALIANLDLICEKASGLMKSGERHALSAVRLKSPVANPTKVIGAPVNYYAHMDEANEDKGVSFGQDIKSIDHYGLFLKNPVLVGAGEGVELHFTDRRNDHEVEVAMIIGKTAKNISYDNALDYVSAYAIGLDMTVRGTEERSLRKAIDSYSVLGPWLVTADEIVDPDKLDFSIHVGDDERQNSNTDKLIFDCRRLIEYGSSFYTLYPGDVIMTGTPEGVGPVVAGDTMYCYCEGIGEMSVEVRAAG
tara:strand:- start:976 stop:1842 length:867 start_codon:yes stop_codon:yes gene_type:complete